MTDELEGILSDYTLETLRSVPQFIERSINGNGNLEMAKDVLEYAKQLTKVKIPNQSIERFILDYKEPIQRSTELDFIKKANVNLQDEYPETCDKSCPHVQCSSWGISEMQGRPCRNRVKTNEEASLRSTSGYRVRASNEPILMTTIERNWNETIF